MMNLKSQITGLNDFLTQVYGAETRISTLLNDLGFEQRQIDLLRDRHIAAVVSEFIAAIEERLTSGAGGDRLSRIISRRYGLDGEPPETLQALGDIFGISRERVRQLEAKAIRKCKSKVSREFFRGELHSIVLSHLDLVGERPTGDHIIDKLNRLAEIRAAAQRTHLDYEAKRAEILQPVQAELEALEAEYHPLLVASSERLAELETEIKNDVLLRGESVHSSRYQAIYIRGRVSWDTQGLAEYAESHPELLEYRKQGRPNVSLRVVADPNG